MSKATQAAVKINEASKIIHKHINKYDEAVELLGGLRKCIPRCRCDVAYKDRQMVDPNCFRCYSFSEGELAKIDAFLAPKEDE